MKNVDKPILITVLATAAGAILAVAVASRRDLTRLESSLFYAFGLTMGIVASYVFGRHSSRRLAEELVKASAPSAFRRVTGLYEAFGRLVQGINSRRQFLEEIGAENGGQVELGYVRLTFDALEAQVTEQLGTANDAVADWEDLAPTEVAALRAKAQRLADEDNE